MFVSDCYQGGEGGGGAKLDDSKKCGILIRRDRYDIIVLQS